MTKLQDFLNSPVPQKLSQEVFVRTGDLFGLEIECEGEGVAWDGKDAEVIKMWNPVRDGSLRSYLGHSPQEWIFKGPVSFENSKKRVEGLFDYFSRKKTKLVMSNRCSVHVHYNMSDKNCYQVVNLFILYTILEDILDNYCGDDRRGNLFCLSSRMAEGQVGWVGDALFRYNSFAYIRNSDRYCSLNLASLNKFGSVEFRGMRGLDNQEDIIAWLKILSEFCEYAVYKMKNPITVVENLSLKGPETFLREIFSAESYQRLTDKISIEDIQGSMYEGVRLIQMMCYRVGTEFDQVKFRGKDFWASLGESKNHKNEAIVEDAPELRIKPLKLNRARLGDFER